MKRILKPTSKLLIKIGKNTINQLLRDPNSSLKELHPIMKEFKSAKFHYEMKLYLNCILDCIEMLILIRDLLKKQDN
jgi:nicotinamide mononucleotide adenylyltransferase